MTTTTMSGRQFNQDTGRAKRAARAGPVFITDRGRPSHVLVTIDEYRRLTGSNRNILDALAPDQVQNFEFEPPRLEGSSLKIPDFD